MYEFAIHKMHKILENTIKCVIIYIGNAYYIQRRKIK
nr:MAG TPA: hypothetical protein [Caudoviricetes sp.]